MKKYLLYLISVVGIATLTLSSCEDMFGDFLDKQPSNELTEEQVFGSWRNTEYYYYDIYNFLRNGLGRINSSWMDAATDLGVTSFSWGGTRYSFNVGNYYSTGGAPEINDTWYHYYRGIRKCNTLLEKIDGVPLSAEENVNDRKKSVDRIKAEARFFRAYFYWELAIRYGAVPLVTTRLNPEDESIKQIDRPASVKENFQFILNELDDCYSELSSEWEVASSDLGRITKGVNLALKSRIMLYMASPRYSSLGLATWQDAVDVAEEFITYFGEGKFYSLMTQTDQALGYQLAISRRKQDGNPEVIFWRNDGRGDWWRNESPVGFGGNGGLCPSQNLVDMYDMANGLSPFTGYDATGAPIYNSSGGVTVNIASGYNDQSPYLNRDPRFYKTVLHNGAIWWNRPIDTTEGGTDNPSGNANATPTGYYNRKYLDDSQTHYRDGGVMFRNWIFIRYAEILLNYAEALNEVNGPSATVFSTLQKLRNRVGITSLLSGRTDLQTKEALRNFIRKERTIELAFEDHRYWDVRRWNVAVESLSRPIYGFSIVKNGANTIYTRQVAQKRVFVPKMYLYPIPEAEIWRTGIENNPDW